MSNGPSKSSPGVAPPGLVGQCEIEDIGLITFERISSLISKPFKVGTLFEDDGIGAFLEFVHKVYENPFLKI